MIVITGASRGIGKYLFNTYLQKDQIVRGTYNSTLPELCDYLTKIDVTDFDSVKFWVNEIAPLDRQITLISCAGISYNSYSHKADQKQWAKVIDVNLIGTFNLINCFLPHMREKNFGRIINFGSVVAQLPTPGVSAYAASKSALWGLTKTIAIENASKGITINTINLGYSNIGMGINEVPREFQTEMLKKHPLKRFCEPIEIFNTIEFLRETAYINGESINLNGGLL